MSAANTFVKIPGIVPDYAKKSVFPPLPAPAPRMLMQAPAGGEGGEDDDPVIDHFPRIQQPVMQPAAWPVSR